MCSHTIKLNRRSIDNTWNNIKYSIFDKDVINRPIVKGFITCELDYEFDAIKDLIESLKLCYPALRHLTFPLMQGYRQLILERLVIKNNWERSITVSVFPFRETHLSCASSKKVKNQSNQDEENSQKEIKYKLAELGENSKITKFFTENSCLVCASTYHEILDDNLHVVVSSCKHVICCKCADRILKRRNPVCPQCRRKVSADSFELMKFNNNHEQDSQNQKIFL